MDNLTKTDLLKLFEEWSGAKVKEVVELPSSGSYREYFRIRSDKKNVIGAFNPDKKENLAFLKFTGHFLEYNLPVPQIYASDVDKNIYLIQDLGDVTLFSFLTEKKTGNKFSTLVVPVYKKVIEKLPEFQIRANEEFDYNFCYPRAAFDKQSMLWDLNYFKYYFLKLAKIPFDEQELENDFHRFTDFLLKAESDFFMYRDFQSRNVMLVGSEPFFIDYQGGRKGALQYDLASLLFDSKADIPQKTKDELLNHYLDVVSEYKKINREQFIEYYYGFVLIRLLQAMGAYGFRGFYEKKTHFLKSIPFALKNLEWFLKNITLPVKLPVLLKTLEDVVLSAELKKYGTEDIVSDKLTLEIKSFSYQKGIPVDTSGNGGGFVFDCRLLHNPGKYEQFKNLTGKDMEVIKFFENEPEVKNFLKNVFEIIDQAVEKYLKRNFKHLSVNFGCTGGQHRSVYCSEKLSERLQKKYNLNVVVSHTELESEKDILR
jgi:aminoglycoside/choline kinase family phosphotransferase